MEFTYKTASEFFKAIHALEELGLDYQVRKETIKMEKISMGPDKTTWYVTATKNQGTLNQSEP